MFKKHRLHIPMRCFDVQMFVWQPNVTNTKRTLNVNEAKWSIRTMLPLIRLLKSLRWWKPYFLLLLLLVGVVNILKTYLKMHNKYLINYHFKIISLVVCEFFCPSLTFMYKKSISMRETFDIFAKVSLKYRKAEYGIKSYSASSSPPPKRKGDG